jgi:hypothetical protein
MKNIKNMTKVILASKTYVDDKFLIKIMKDYKDDLPFQNGIYSFKDK